MFKFYNDCTFEDSNSFDWVSLFALIVSLVSVICSFYFVYLGKKIEIISAKFQKFCIDNIEKIITPIENKFSQSGILISTFRNDISICTSDIQLFCFTLLDIYPEITFDEIEKLTDEFSDRMYEVVANNPNALCEDHKVDFLQFKILIYSKLYDFVLNKELNPISRFKIWIKGRK
jgi:hypothetical protein